MMEKEKRKRKCSTRGVLDKRRCYHCSRGVLLGVVGWKAGKWEVWESGNNGWALGWIGTVGCGRCGHDGMFVATGNNKRSGW